jgi:L-asparaginase II
MVEQFTSPENVCEGQTSCTITSDAERIITITLQSAYPVNLGYPRTSRRQALQLIPLIERTRGGIAECTHFGAVAVVNTRGQLVARVGDPHYRTFTRSTLKALQALPFVEGGGPAHFGFSTAQIAMLCASHSGEEVHVLAAESMLTKAGQTYKVLRCGCHVPYHFDTTHTPLPADLAFDERHHNCSGKHAGFIAYCVQNGLPLDSYLEPAHPLQQHIRTTVAQAFHLAPEELGLGIDGCSAPNYAMPLFNLALGYARLASGAADAQFGESFASLSDAMTSHPEMVSGTGRNDLDFMRAGRGDWVSKVGADGVQVLGSKSRSEAFAIKISDGDKPSLFAASVEVLEQLGWLDDAQRAVLEPWRARSLPNLRGIEVGTRRPVFQLQTP